MKLFISPGIHVGTNVERRIEEIEEGLGSVDVIFVESQHSHTSFKTKALNVVAAPLLLLTIYLVFSLFKFASKILSADVNIAQDLSERYDANIHYVDYSIHKIIKGSRSSLFIANYFAIFLILILLRTGSFSSEVDLFVASLLATAVVSLVGAFLAGTNLTRENHIIAELHRLANEHEYEHVCLTCGSDHGNRLHEIAGTYSDIELKSKPKKSVTAKIPVIERIFIS